jgi:hypothetical protein
MNRVLTFTFAQVKNALLQRKLVYAVYRGFQREMCPHVLGWKAGKEHPLFFQVGGSSSKGLRLGGAWRCLNLPELSDVSIQDGPWRTGAGYYDNPQGYVDEIDVRIP